MADAFETFIRFLHLFTGVMWVGGIFLWAMVVGPSLRKRVSPDAVSPVVSVVGPRVERYHGIAGLLTIVTGFWTMANIVGGVGNAFQSFQDYPWGVALGAAFVLAIGMLVLHYAFIYPAMSKYRNLTAGAGAGGDELTALQKRATMGLMVNMLAGIIVLGLMAWAVTSRTVA